MAPPAHEKIVPRRRASTTATAALAFFGMAGSRRSTKGSQRMLLVDVQDVNNDDNIFVVHPRAVGDAIRIRCSSAGIAKKWVDAILYRRNVVLDRIGRRPSEDISGEELGKV